MDILGSPVKEIHRATGALSKLWRQILARRNINSSAAEQLMQRYLDEAAKDYATKDNDKPFDRSSKRSNLCTDLSSTDMTLKSFHKALTFARAKKVKHIVEIEWANGEKDTYSINVELLDELQNTDLNEVSGDSQ